MRILFTNAQLGRYGGAETYIVDVLAGLAARGHDVALLYEVNPPSANGPMPLPAGAPSFGVDSLGTVGAAAAARAWRPDIVFSHTMLSAAMESTLHEIAPTVLFGHNYYGTCISGDKAHRFPTPVTCGRELGPICLAYYLPRRCGGKSPVTMVREYQTQTARKRRLPRFARIVTASEHMRREYIHNGVEPRHVVSVPMYVSTNARGARPSQRVPNEGDEVRLLFVGRAELLKGGEYLLRALPDVQRRLARPVRLVIAGHGTMIGEWRDRAARITAEHPMIRVESPGWLGGDELRAAFATSDLLVVPSLWPEPFGLVGLEAAAYGVPAAAYAVGGIPSWLTHGVNGLLAHGDPPTVDGLADAIVGVLSDASRYAAFRAGAQAAAAAATLDRHLDALLTVFGDVLSGGDRHSLGSVPPTSATIER